MDKKTTTVWKINKNGNLVFHTNEDVIEMENKRTSAFEHPGVVFGLMAICATVDAAMFISLFQSFLYDSVVLQVIGMISMLISFDVCPIIAGSMLKKKDQGYRINKPVLALLIGAFGIGIIINFVLRIDMKDLVLPDLSSTVTSLNGMVETTDTTNSHALVYAIFAGCLPIITSIASFGASYYSTNLLRDELKVYQRIKAVLDEAILQTRSILREYELDSAEKMHEDDLGKYNAAKEQIIQQAVYYCHYAREKIKEHLGNPPATNELSKANYSDLLKRLEIVREDAAGEAEPQLEQEI